MIINRNNILNELKHHKKELLSYGIRQIGLFGSYSRGDNSENSDLDFVVDLENKTFDSYMGLKEYLEDLFGKKVDLVLSTAIKPRLKEKIMNEIVYAGL